MEGAVPGSTMALATSIFPGNTRARLGRLHRPGMALGGGAGICILSEGGERHGCELCLWGQGTAPSLSSSMHLLVDCGWAAPLICACRSLEGAGHILPLFSMRSSVAAPCPAPCPVLLTPSPQEDAHGSGPPVSRGVSVSQLQWQQGVTVAGRICPARIPGRRVP